VGSKWRQSLGGTALSGLEKLKVLRAAIENGDDALGPTENRRRILEMEKRDEIMPVLEKRERIRREEDEGEKWDAESILCAFNRYTVEWALTGWQLRIRIQRITLPPSARDGSESSDR